MSQSQATPPKVIKFKGAEYVLEENNSDTVKAKPKYGGSRWGDAERMIEEHLGLGQVDPPELPPDLKVPSVIEPQIRKLYGEELQSVIPSPDNFLWAVKRAVDHALEEALDSIDVSLSGQARSLVDWLSDSFAHEEMFSAIGGVPEYNFFLDPPWKQLVTAIEAALSKSGESFDDEALEHSLIETAQAAAAEAWPQWEQDFEDAETQAKLYVSQHIKESFLEPARFLKHYLDSVVRDTERPYELTVQDLYDAVQQDPAASHYYETLEDEYGKETLHKMAEKFLSYNDPRQTELTLSSAR